MSKTDSGEVSELVEFFRGEGYSRFGWHGDEMGWSPERTAIEAIRELMKARPEASVTAGIGRWLSAALEDPQVCEEMKADIRAWFDAGEPHPRCDAGSADVMVTAHALVERHIAVFGYVPQPDRLKEAIAAALASPPPSGVREALEKARKRIEYFGSITDDRHREANEIYFLPPIKTALSQLPAAAETGPVIDMLERAKMLNSAGAMRRAIDGAIALVRGCSIPSASRECPNFPGCHCVDVCIDGWEHPSPECPVTSTNRETPL